MNAHPEYLLSSKDLPSILEKQRKVFAENPYPQYSERIQNLRRLNKLIAKNKEALIAAINADFGCRARNETIIAEILGCHGAIHYVEKNLIKWMRKRKRNTSFWSLPAKCYAVAQPLGVVGIMAPWNYSLHLSIAPLVAALAAGNRVMLCMSEETPELCKLVAKMIDSVFPNDLISVFQGGEKLSPKFAALPFDHLLFTGSTKVGKLVAQAAAKNLTPVTLELGGKSPAVVAPDFSVNEAAERISWGKMFNAGQTCVAPDYVLIPQGKVDAFSQAALAKFEKSFSGLEDQDLTGIVSQRFFNRLNALVEEAKSKGATILTSKNSAPISKDEVHKFPLTLVLNPPEDCTLMQEEIFGPILPVIGYQTFEDAIGYINSRERPLSLYMFGHDLDQIKALQRKTVSGSFGLNETLLQYIQEDMAFGGVGASGYGAYHGQEGFDTFSHVKSVIEQRGLFGFTGIKLLHPPYGQISQLVLKMMKG